MYRSMSQSCIKFMEPEQEMRSTTNTFFVTPPKEDVNSASLYAELNIANNNRPRLFLDNYKSIDYEDDRARYHSTIYKAPKDQYKNQMLHNKLMKAYEHQSHTLKTPQPSRK